MDIDFDFLKANMFSRMGPTDGFFVSQWKFFMQTQKAFGNVSSVTSPFLFCLFKILDLLDI